MTTTTTAPAQEQKPVREQDRQLADVLIAGAVYNADTHQIEPGEKAYTNNLPEGLSAADVKKVREYDKAFIAASGLVTGEMGLEQMSSNKELQSVGSSWDMTNGAKMDWTLQRESTSRNPRTGEESVRLGALSPTFSFNAGKSSNGNLTTVRNHITGLANVKIGQSSK